MRNLKNKQIVGQMPMPGMPDPEAPQLVTNCCDISSGQSVVYNGTVAGGPKFGARGIVKEIRVRNAIVDMGRSGTWHIPFYFLTLPQAA